MSEDPSLWLGLRREAPELEPAWLLARGARECLAAIDDPRVRVIVLDGALHDKPAPQLLQLIRRIRPDLPIVFAYQESKDDWEREARAAGVVYYGDRTQLGDMVRVVRSCLRRGARQHIRRGSVRTEGGTA